MTEGQRQTLREMIARAEAKSKQIEGLKKEINSLANSVGNTIGVGLFILDDAMLSVTMEGDQHYKVSVVPAKRV